MVWTAFEEHVKTLLAPYPTLKYNQKWLEIYQDLRAITCVVADVEFDQIARTEHEQNVRNNLIWQATVSMS